MSHKTRLPHICPFKLQDTHHAIYELQNKLGISDEYLLSTSRGTSEDRECRESLSHLLEASQRARDSLITWYLKQTLVQLNVTISLLTAKIKFIEYKLDLCDGIDLHQACSLSLVNFCNILSELTVLNVDPADRKTMHKISVEANVPVWLSHYRNQICHVPSESPCISILVPLVVKSLNYMRDSFWSKVLERDNFDQQYFKKLVNYVASLTHVISINKRLRLKKDAELGKKNRIKAEKSLTKYSKACLLLRKQLIQNPERGLDILVSSLVSNEPEQRNSNSALLIEQVIYARCFEQLVFKMVALAKQNLDNGKVLSWLCLIITLISLRKRMKLRETLRKLELSASVKIIRYTDVPPIKCCHIAYRLMKIDTPLARRLVIKMRYKLAPLLGKQKTLMLIKLTKLSGSRIEICKKQIG